MSSQRIHEPEILLTMVHFRDQSAVLAFTDKALRAARASGVALECAVADNSGDWDDNVPTPQGLIVTKPGRNLGYLNGCAHAFEAWRANHQLQPLPEWIAVMNTDLTLADDFFDRLRATARELPEDVGLVGPDVRLPDGTPQNPFLRARLSPQRIRQSRALFSNSFTGGFWQATHRLRTAIKQRLKQYRRPPSRGINDEPTEFPKWERIYAPHGSFMLLNRRYFELGGSLECRSFMYGEEIHLAERCRRLRLSAVWIPLLNVRHDAKTSTKLAGSARRGRWLHQSYQVIWEDYYHAENEAGTRPSATTTETPESSVAASGPAASPPSNPFQDTLPR